jgi:hypothetical protein
MVGLDGYKYHHVSVNVCAGDSRGGSDDDQVEDEDNERRSNGRHDFIILVDIVHKRGSDPVLIVAVHAFLAHCVAKPLPLSGKLPLETKQTFSEPQGGRQYVTRH